MATAWPPDMAAELRAAKVRDALAELLDAAATEDAAFGGRTVLMRHLADAILASPWLAEFAAAQRAAGAAEVAERIRAERRRDPSTYNVWSRITGALPEQPRPAPPGDEAQPTPARPVPPE